MIKFYLGLDTSNIVVLPVNPPSIEVKQGGTNKVLNIVKLGEINILREMHLQKINFSSFFPAITNQTANILNNPWTLIGSELREPQYYIDAIEKTRAEKKPIVFTVSDVNISMEVSIEDFTWKQEAGDADIHYTIALKQYQRCNIKTLKQQTSSSTSSLVSGALSTAIKATVSSNITRAQTSFAVGDTVTVNGKYWYDSYGAEPSGTFKNFTGRIDKIVADTTRKYRYHISTLDGGWRGWVSKDQLGG